MVQVIKMSCYNYYDGFYRLNRVTGTIALDSARNASRTDNFTYDVSGRMIADSSKSLSVEYDPYGMPVSFVQTLDSSVWRELMVYDASGWRVATLAYENDSLRATRSDIMVGGKKVLERRRTYAASDSSVAEYRMIQGKSGIVGRILPDSSKEWYVKDYQGSLVMTLVENGTGNVLSYEPYGAQKKIKVSGDSPAEQYTGKEYDERIGLYYYGMRFFDSVLGLWISPDPARQYMNLYAFGGDPVNRIDHDGRISWKSIGKGIGAIVGSGFVAGVAPAIALGAGMTVDAMTGGLASTALIGVSAVPATISTPIASSVTKGEFSWQNVAFSATKGSRLDLVGGIGPAAGMLTTYSYSTRCVDDLKNCGFVASDAIWGGFLADNAGHMLGLANFEYMGGSVDNYNGNYVYSGGVVSGPLKYANGGEDFGASHFGHAVFVSDRKHKDLVAHELTHIRQIERQGFRIGYISSYLNNGSISSKGKGYHANPYEIEAYYFQFLYNQGYVDVYGNIKKGVEENHEKWSKQFYEEGYYDIGHEGEDKFYHEGYKKKYSDAKERYDEHWIWEKDWSFNEAN